MKRCSRCGEEKPEAQFHVRTRRGKKFTQTFCKECNSAYGKAHYTANKAYYVANAAVSKAARREEAIRFVLSFLQEHPCVDCGLNDPVVMQFDHVDGKFMEISRMVSRGMAVTNIQAEISKCQVRCANCHARKTAKERGYRMYQILSP